MLSKKELIILMSLIFTGLLVALKLFHIDYMINYSDESYQSFCNINKTFNCDAVAASPYSYFLGVPIALFGVLGNLFLIAIYPFLLRTKADLKIMAKGFYFLIFILYSIGCLVLMSISFTLITSFCLLCMVYWVLSFGTLTYLLFILKGDMSFSFLKKLLDTIWINRKVFIFLLLSYLIISFSIAHLGLSKNCSGPSLKSCQHYDEKNNISFLGESSGYLPITIYTDFECPYCRKINGYIEKLAEKYKKKIKLIRKEFPLDQNCNPLLKKPFHQQACLAAYYAKCAGSQGKYWEFHNQLYKTTKVFGDELFMDIAEDLGLNLNRLKSCIVSDEIRQTVSKEIEEAIKLKIEGTPTFKIFGEVLPEIISEKDIQQSLATYPFIERKIIDNVYAQGLESTMQIFDIRDQEEWAKWHFKGAIPINYTLFKEEILSGKSKVLSFHGDVLIYGNSRDEEKLRDLFQIIKNAEVNVRILKL